MILINPLSHTYKCIPDDKQFNLIQQKIQTLSRNYIFSKKERKKKTRKIISFFMVMFVYKIYVYTIDRTHKKAKKSKESSCSRSQRKLNAKENIFRFLHCLKLRNNNNNNCVMIFKMMLKIATNTSPLLSVQHVQFLIRNNCQKGKYTNHVFPGSVNGKYISFPGRYIKQD